MLIPACEQRGPGSQRPDLVLVSPHNRSEVLLMGRGAPDHEEESSIVWGTGTLQPASIQVLLGELTRSVAVLSLQAHARVPALVSADSNTHAKTPM